MTTAEVLLEARLRGVELSVDGPDRIRYRGPRGALEDGFLEQIRRHKPGLLQALRCSACTVGGRIVFPRPTVCWCRRAGTVSVKA